MKQCGVLLHISSLRGKHGIGSLGEEAYRFVDFLKKANQDYWQVLPLGQTSYGDSPYQTFSVYAGNPYFIDLDLLIKDGLLKRSDIKEYEWPNDSVDYAGLFYYRYETLKKIRREKLNKDELNEFYLINQYWLDEYALFMAIKFDHSSRPWNEWEKDIKLRKPDALEFYKNKLKKEIEFYKILQYLFFKQWQNLKDYANQNGVKIIGDMPIYVAYDSADVWANPENFNLNKKLQMKTVAGCPPDCFSDFGQLWGNPIYNWKKMADNGYEWWTKRIKFSAVLYDLVRIDHFRGFASFYEIPFGMENAKIGKWKTGPRYKLFEAIKNKAPEVKIIAEDLGFITTDVHKLMRKTKYPGMKVLQFGMDAYSEHNADNFKSPNYVVYTGTHDNNTSRGKFEELNENSNEKAFAVELMKKYRVQKFAHALIHRAYNSICDYAIIPMQDVLNLGGEARMNTPSTLGDNWKWRMPKYAVNNEFSVFLNKLTIRYKRGKQTNH